MPNIRNSNYYVPSRSRRYSYPEMYGQKSMKDYRMDDEDLYYEQNGGDNSGIGNADSDGMAIYSKPMEQMNPNSPEMHHSYFHSNRITPLRANITSQCEISPTLPIMNYSQISQYTRPTGMPVNINNNCYKASPLRDKSVYVNYHNPVYECSVNQSQYQMNQQRLLEATHLSPMKRPARMYALKKKKSSGIPTVATPRYVRAGRHNSVISMPLATKVEAPRRPVCTQTSPQNGGFLDKPIRKDSFIHIKRPKTAVGRRTMVPITCAPANNYDESQDSSEVQENFHLELRNVPNPKKIVSKTSNGTEIEIAKYQKMFVQNNMPSKKLDDKPRKPIKVKKSKSSTHSSLKSSPQPEKENPTRSKENKEENDTDSLLNSLINDIEGAFANETLDGKSQIKQMMDKMKAATENGIKKMNTTPTGSPNCDKKSNDLLKDLKIDQNSSSSYNDYLTKKALNQAHQPNLTGYQKCTSSGLGFDPKISNMQLDELNKAASNAEMELHRSKTIVVNLIDREISRTNSNQAIAVEPLSSTLNIDAGDAIDYVQKSNNMLKEMQITEAVTDTLLGTKYPKPTLVDTGRENKYLRWLKKARKNHLKNIHRELEQLEELDETIDPSN